MNKHVYGCTNAANNTYTNIQMCIYVCRYLYVIDYICIECFQKNTKVGWVYLQPT